MDKRILIYLNGVKVISENGFFNTKVQDIVSSANVSVGSFYNYFNDKNDLLYFIFESRLLSLNKKLDEILLMKISPIDRIECYFDFIIKEYQNNSELQKVINEESWALYRSLENERKEKYSNLCKSVEDKFINIVENGQSLGIINPTPPLIIYNLFNSLISDSFNTYKFDRVNTTPEATKLFFMNLIINKK